ncbi:alpha/beta-hydrolase [Fomes fomentarius]|nr:alpha/beta-hydrolase [Fomes fomentarius]
MLGFGQLLTTILGVVPADFSYHDGIPKPQTNITIQWGSCDRFAVNDTKLNCAVVEVPLDYHNPSVGNAQLAVIKLNATGERRGTVFVNPGGPGGSGIDYIRDGQDLLLSLTGGVYDVVSWDPRGIGFTVPGETHCFDSAEEYTAFFNGTIELTGIEETGNFTDPTQIRALLSQAETLQKKYKEVAHKCKKSPNGRFLRYLGTAANVRDIISLADAIDGPDEPVNYYGISYGTLIGSWLVNMFPERVGRVMVDGVVDPVIYSTEEIATHGAYFFEAADTVYSGMITGCALAGPKGCVVAEEGDGPLEINTKFQALLEAAYQATLKNASAPISSGLIRLGLSTEVYFPKQWSSIMNEILPPIIAAVLAESGQNQTLVKRITEGVVPNSFVKRQSGTPQRTYSVPGIFCGDSIDPNPHTNMTDVLQAIVAGTQNISHIFGSKFPSLTSPCALWPFRSVERYQGPFNKKLANKILIASTTARSFDAFDPITPIRGARTLAGLLGDDAVLVELHGFGHPTFATESACMTNTMAAYMVNGTLPANNTVCEADADWQVFEGVTQTDIFANLPKFGI